MAQFFSMVSFWVGIIGTIAALASLGPGNLKFILVIVFLLLLIIGAIKYLSIIFDLKNAVSILISAKQLGIKRIHAYGRSGKQMTKALKNAKNISILTASGSRFFWMYKATLTEALLKQRTNIKVALATPQSEFVKDIEEAEQRTSGNRADLEIDQVLAVLSECAKNAREKEKDEKRVGTIQVGHFTTQLRSTMIICDSWAWMNIALPPKTAVDSVTFELIEYNKGYFNDCLNHFNRIWNIIEKKGTVRLL